MNPRQICKPDHRSPLRPLFVKQWLHALKIYAQVPKFTVMAGLPSITPWSVSSFVLQLLGAASYPKGGNLHAIGTWMTSPED